ncbi:hypothetical protein SAMN05421504_10499 [Amycolatopsis xylanica]|uniref:Membrane-bound lytic murein transglycosylase B n=1 Tax=Amycolatopsis xylanica TaxID=589385 RepID=A0A1H3G2D3_9PSEU|nr:hypothetical protein SAMN05421504_10499 [Amycolatopsis xylanica]
MGLVTDARTSPLSLLDQEQPPHPERKSRRGCAIVAMLLVACLVAVAIWIFDSLSSRPQVPIKPRFEVPALLPEPKTAIPGEAGALPSAETLDAWVAKVSDRTDIPLRALRAYVNAATVTAEKSPDCRITWATIAGIGRIESQHGRHGNSDVDADGDVSPPIIGPALDGSPGFQKIPDTDKGKLDTDAEWDRAVGPMQFLPATWKRWSVRANGDGAAPDPQNIDDAALTTARYMCAKGGDLADPVGWWTAVLTYNNSAAYGREVFSNADAYGKAALKP